MHVKINSNICRICLQTEARYSLFENKNAEKFTFITLLEISEKDNLPSCLCERCNLALRVAAFLKRQAISTNVELKSYLKRVNESFLTLPSKTKVVDTISDINVNELASLYCQKYDVKDNQKLTEIFVEENNYDDDHNVEFLRPVNPFEDVGVLKRENNFNDEEEYGDIEELLDETSTFECDEISTEINTAITLNETSTKNRVEIDTKIEKLHVKSKNNLDYFSETNLFRNNELNNDENSELHQNIDNDSSEEKINKTNSKNLKNNRKYKKRRYIADVIRVSSVLKEPESTQNEKKKVVGIVNDKFRCGECESTFTTKLNLGRHMEIHLNRRKAFSCDQCGKLFTKLNSVQEHMLTHTGERPHKCDICGKAFYRRQIYKRHLLTHTRTKKFECNQCDKKFTVKNTLTVHVKRVHGNWETIQHKCQICSKSYRSKYTLSDHLQNIHNITI